MAVPSDAPPAPRAQVSAPSSTKRDARTFVILMGVVALFGDMTYEGARGIVGPYIGLLGASAATIGFVAGLGEFLGYGLRFVTGWFADRTRAYWPLVFAGYATNLFVILGLALVGTWQAAIALLLLERIGKAIRSPARSTLVSYAANEAGVGASFGLEEALDQIGAVVGPLLTAAAIWGVRGEPAPREYRTAFAVLLLPVFANLACLVFARRRYPRPETFEAEAPKSTKPLGRVFIGYVAGVCLLALGFADWALVSFHAAKTALVGIEGLPVVYAGAMGTDALAALAFGRAYDRHGVTVLAIAALASACFAPLVFLAPSVVVFIAGAAFWSIGMGAQESVFKAVIADVVPKAERGRAYGIFFAAFGFAWWIGSAILGSLYERSLGALVAFSVVTQLAAAPVFVFVGRSLRSR